MQAFRLAISDKELMSTLLDKTLAGHGKEEAEDNATKASQLRLDKRWFPEAGRDSQ
jgi:hypothetical protein